MSLIMILGKLIQTSIIMAISAICGWGLWVATTGLFSHGSSAAFNLGIFTGLCMILLAWFLFVSTYEIWFGS